MESSVDCGGQFVVGTTSPTPDPKKTGKGPAPAPPVQLKYTVWIVLGNNGACQQFQLGNQLTVSPTNLPVGCTPATPTALAPAPVLNPTTIAINYWHTIPLPKPVPQIPPGYAITGKLAYLLTNGSLHPHPYVTNTPLGNLTVIATGTYEVDWGDSAGPVWDGPFDQEGLAWPSGQIFHTYDTAGTYTVTVQENWTATWTLGPDHGTLARLQTIGAIPNYLVEQLQAINTN